MSRYHWADIATACCLGGSFAVILFYSLSA
jgi:hypothetical protein